MNSNYLLTLTSISQWALFLGIAFILFGWIEKKEKFVIVGQLAFLFLGLITLWVLLTGGISAPEVAGGIVSKQIKVLTFLKLAAIFSGFNIVSLLLKLFKLRFQKISVYILMFFALALFFMVFNIQQMAN